MIIKYFKTYIPRHETALGDIMTYSDAYIVNVTTMNADGSRGDGVSSTRSNVVTGVSLE